MVYTICMSVQEKEKRWIKNSPTIIVVNSIFAAIAGILFVLVVSDFVCPYSWWQSLPFILSFFLFSWTAERTTDAIDKKDTGKYVAYMLPYNIGVVLLFLGIWLIFLHRYNFSLGLFFISFLISLVFLSLFFGCSKINWRKRWRLLVLIILQVITCFLAYCCNSLSLKVSLISWLAGFALGVFSSPWLADSWWLLSRDEEEFGDYEKELDEEKGDPEKDSHIWELLFYALRKPKLWQYIRKVFHLN